jgi:aspartyl-tRNA(Asn)/glutamyl-tRNA(Gln) amidotransferase subunit B
VTPVALAELLELVEQGSISGKIAKQVFAGMVETGVAAADIIRDKGLSQVSDEEALRALVREVLAANPEQVAQFREGKTKVMGFLVGQLMKKSKGQANPQVANRLMQEELTG